MLYKLLRDNVETGPFTKSELMNMELLSSDFLRPDVEGSKWILASKFTELKNKFSDSIPDKPKSKPKYKITADGKMIEISTADTNQTITNQAPTEVDNIGSRSTPSPEKTEDTPLFRRTPSAVPKKKNEEYLKEKTPFEYQFKSENTSSKVATTTAFATEPPKAPKEKKKKVWGNILKEFIIPILILGAIFGGWSYWNSKTGNGSIETRKSVNAMLEDQEGSKESTDLVATNSPENNTPNITTVPVQMPATDTSAVIAPPPPQKNTDSLARISAANIAKKRKEDSLAIVNARNSEKEKALAAEKEKTAKAAADKKAEEDKKTVVANKPTESGTKPATTAPAATEKKAGDVRDYVRLQLNNPAKDGFVNAKIKVNNISSTKLDVAVVRVRYLDEKSNVLKSETVQVDNIPAGRSVIVSIPDNKTAAKISYGVTMISGQDVYIMRK